MRTATLVDPRVTVTDVPPHTVGVASLKRTKIRLLAGLSGMVPDPVTKAVNVGVALAAIEIVTVGVGGSRHAQVAGLVRHSATVVGSVASPVSAETVRVAVTPTLVVAMANTLVPVGPERLT